MFAHDVVERPVPLAAETFESMLIEAHAALLTDFECTVSTEGVDNNDVVAPAQRLNAARKVDFLVQRKDHRRDGNGLIGHWICHHVLTAGSRGAFPPVHAR